MSAKIMGAIAFGFLAFLTGGVVLGAETADEPPIVDPNLIGWWNFEEGGGAVALDASGYGHHGTLMGDPQWVPGYDGLALDLDGDGDYIETGKVPSELGIAGDAPRTVALWVYPRSFDGGGLYEMGGDGDREGFSLLTEEPDYLWKEQYGGIDANFSGPKIDEWAHLAHVYSSGRADIYVNAYYPDRWTLDLRTSDEKPFRIGTSAGATFNGLIDDIRLYNRAMTRDEVQRVMYGSPLIASGPQPADGVLTDIARASELKWDAGALAVEHDVYLGTDEAEVSEATVATEGIYRGRWPAEATSYEVPESPLAWNGMYYWRVDEVDAEGEITVGKVWSFQTADYLIIDDFESYNDEDNRIYNTWIDGWDNGTTSTVGYLETICFPVTEPIWGHTGDQGMPFAYENTEAPWYAEAFRVWDTPKDLTKLGVDTLTLYLIGYPIDFLECADGTIVMSGYARRSNEPVDRFRFACKVLRGDGAVTVRVDRLGGTGPWDQAGVMMREAHDDNAKHVGLLVTAGHGLLHQYRSSDGGSLGYRMQEGVQVPYWVRLVRVGDMFTASYSTDGTDWTAASSPRTDSSMKIPMSHDIYVGLVVSSDSWRSPTSAAFSSVSVDGDLTGPWGIQEIGGWQPHGNDPDRVYVGLVDEAGNVAAVHHPDDPLAVGAAVWQHWGIPLSEFAGGGVDLTGITQVLVGVGDRDRPTPGGGGMIHFDDFRLTRSEAQSSE